MSKIGFLLDLSSRNGRHKPSSRLQSWLCICVSVLRREIDAVPRVHKNINTLFATAWPHLHIQFLPYVRFSSNPFDSYTLASVRSHLLIQKDKCFSIWTRTMNICVADMCSTPYIQTYRMPFCIWCRRHERKNYSTLRQTHTRRELYTILEKAQLTSTPLFQDGMFFLHLRLHQNLITSYKWRV